MLGQLKNLGGHVQFVDLGLLDLRNENDYHYVMEESPKTHAEAPNHPDRKLAAGSSPYGVTSDQLLGGARELLILHAGRQYRLRLTQNGKLILTA